MYFVSFIICFACALIAAIVFGRGLVKIYQRNNVKARGLVAGGFGVGLAGIVIWAIIFGFFSL